MSGTVVNGIGLADYRHPTERFELKRGTTPAAPYGKGTPTGDMLRIDVWMRWKRVRVVRKMLALQLERARKRGSRTTPVKLADLEALLAALPDEVEPK